MGASTTVLYKKRFMGISIIKMLIEKRKNKEGNVPNES